MNLRAPNNFDFLRFLAASLVLFSHSFPLTLAAKYEPIFLLTHGRISGGRIAVIVFFVLSGFLITASWEGKQDLQNFLLARIKRIFPALVVVLALTVVFGMFITTASLYEYSRSAAVYFVKNVTLYKGQFDIEGVFDQNPYGAAINGSLWTLRHEFTCYVLVALLGQLRVLRKHVLWLIWFFVVIALWVIPISSNFLNEFLPLSAWFLSGSIAYTYRDFELSRFSVIGCVVVIAVAVLFGVNLVMVSPVIAYLLIQVSYLRSPFLNFGKCGDFSYGMYIYAFPIQQLVIYFLIDSASDPLNPWVVSLYSFPLTLLLSVASWNIVEKRFLHRRVMAV